MNKNEREVGAMSLSPEARADWIAAGFRPSEVDAWTLCDCGNGEPAFMKLDHRGLVCVDCYGDWLDESEWDFS